MKPRERQSRILDLVGRDGETTVEALAALFSVSAETIRRDLFALASSGALQKVRGGARRFRLHAEGSYQERMADHAEAKAAIGRKLAAIIEPGETLFMDTGTTTLACAKALTAHKDLTVITNSPRIADALARGEGGATVYLLGGRYGSASSETTGPMAIEQVGRFQADHTVLTVAALDAEAGAMDADFDEAQMARAMIASGRSLIVVAHKTKVGRRAAFHVCRLGEIDMLVSDERPDAGFSAALAAADVALV